MGLYRYDYKVDIEVIPSNFFNDIPIFTQFSLTLMIKERERATMYNAKIFTYISIICWNITYIIKMTKVR